MQEKQDEREVPDVSRDDWNAEELVEQSSGEDSDETVRKILRDGEEAKGDADDRDIAGAADPNETPQASEENKHQAEEEKNG